MKFLILNDLPFAREIGQTGHDIYQKQVQGQETLADIVQAFQLKYSCLPDMILLHCMGNTPLPTDMASSPCPVVIYCMDSCLNEFWIKHYARLCHQVFVDQQSSVQTLAAQGITAHWLPLSVPESLFLPEVAEQDKVHDLVFVGRFHPHRVKRNNLISLLEKHFSIYVVGRGAQSLSVGEMVTLFSRSRVVINENLFDGLTLRVFQALASGSLLLTEESSSMSELFQPGKHLLTFTPDNVIEQVNYALSHGKERREIALAGQQECREGHCSAVRAKEFLAALRPVSASHSSPSVKEKRLHEVAAHYALELRYPERKSLARCARTVQELCAEPDCPAGARFLYALMGARGHMPGHQESEACPQPSSPAELRAFIDDESFLLATKEPQGWLAALSWGYALATGPASTRGNALPAFQLAIQLILRSFPKTEQLLVACQRLMASAEMQERGWALDMAMADMYMAVNRCFETGFSKAKPERIPQCAAECLDKILTENPNFEAQCMLAQCYRECRLFAEEAFEYALMRPFLPEFPELQSKIQASEKLLYCQQSTHA